MNSMNNQPSICIITGAGFSKPAGLPIAKEIDCYFIRDNKDKILHFSSGEKMWFDFANQTYRHNGRIHDEYMMWGYMLNKLVQSYIEKKGQFVNYEDFYQFTIDLFQNKFEVESIFENARKTAEEENPYYSKSSPDYEFRVYPFKNVPRYQLIDLINELVGDLLYVRSKGDEIKKQYNSFIEKLKNYNEINIISLNHDLLMETIISKELGRNFSDGFTRNQNILFCDDKPLNVYQSAFDEDITLLKLHGSIDMYKYEVCDQIGSSVTPTGKYLYFKTHNYTEKQSPQRKNPDTGEIVQTFHRSISPQFITGTRKDEIIATQELYNTLYNKFAKQIANATELLIVGYSFSDKHINERIQYAINNSKLNSIININPTINFPYSVNKQIEITNLPNISCL